MKLQPAKNYRINAKVKAFKKPSMKTLAKTFVNGHLRENIEAVVEGAYGDNCCIVNIAIPIGAYGNFDEFVKACQEILKPLGFEAPGAQDVTGISNTLLVMW